MWDTSNDVIGLKVKAFQINADALFTIQDTDGKLVTSGISFGVSEQGEDIVLRVSGVGRLLIRLDSQNRDPERVGREPGQTRVHWEGHVIGTEDEIPVVEGELL